MPKLFLPTENSTKEKIQSDVEFLKKSKLLHELLVAITAPVVIFNENGEIIYANEMMETVSQYKSDALIGMRIGDSLDCIHSKLISEGCGTADFCKGCDITKVISSSLEGKKGKEECQVTRVVDSTQDNLELEVTATPFEYYERIYTVFVIRDIQNQKRKRELERIFFHDILNTTGNLKNLIDVIKTQGKENIDTELFEMLEETSQHVISEIQQQRELLAAENNDLTVNYTLINSFDVVNYIYHQYIHYKTENKVQLKIASKAGNIVFKTDPVLCERVLGNLTKNALEASSNNDVVTLDCYLFDDNWIEFSVHNPAVISKDIQLQIFQRSFSTKGENRGLGTYSVKLLSEQYLNGKVRFSSEAGKGTTFYVRYPLTKKNIE